MITRWFHFGLLMLVAMLVCVPVSSRADDNMLIGAGGVNIATPPATQGAAGGTGATVAPGEIAQGSKQALATISGFLGNIINAAVTVSQTIRDQSDKAAGGLAVITIVLAGVRFAATRDPVAAWGAAFEELAILGIFASLYLGFETFAPGFYGWFVSLSQKISGTDMTSVVGAMFGAGGQLFDAFIQSFKGASWWEYPATFAAVIPLVGAWLVLTIAAIVFVYYINIGLIQMAIGTVMGQLAIALGFSEFTRGYFKTWLDYMISAGMYVVVAAIMQKLVTATILEAVTTAAQNGLTTPLAASKVMDLSIFMLLLAFEIPKMAGMFGGGANASGAALGKLAKVATKGLV
ncbi:type IV secretion system protein [Burkholderia sp. Ac-20353]|uniref:type IV secretion system protein n=1 Tax=Burkholderia sp. Ac-20353 TaxID=2703894 RepID=UPI00197B61AB|nr:type IV secretion system protein [Burkholderia sp. Ac-20353]MBN3785651.1 type IV secretion system protein [Burkholderia sp. Ac-20353]